MSKVFWYATPDYGRYKYIWMGLLTPQAYNKIMKLPKEHEIEFPECSKHVYPSCCLGDIQFTFVTDSDIDTLKRCGIDMDHDLIDIIDPCGVIFKNH